MNQATDPVSSFDPTGSRTLQVIAGARRFNKWTYDTIRPWLKGEILEIGSGLANISSFAIKEGLSISLSDINPEYRDWLDVHYPEIPVSQIDLQHPDFNEAYASLEERYDSIFFLNVIEHLADDKAAVEHVYFLLKPGGHAIVLAPSYQGLYCRLDKELGHYRRYTKNKLAALFATGPWVVLKKTYFNLAGIAGWFLFGKLLGRKQLGGEMSAYDKLVPVFKVGDELNFHSAGLSTIVVAKKIAV